MMSRANMVYLLNHMNNKAREVQLGDIIFGDFRNYAETISGSLSYGSLIQPKASSALTGVTRHALLCIGDLSGNTAYGFGDVAKSTNGVMIGFGRTAIATSAFTGVDTGLDVRCINKLVNDAAYSMQGLYVKAKNYTDAVMGVLIGIKIECVNDGTASSSTALKIHSDGSVLTHAIDMSSCPTTNGMDIVLSSGISIGSGTAAPSHAAAVGSLYIRTAQTDVKAVLYLCTVASGTWVLLNTVIA